MRQVAQEESHWATSLQTSTTLVEPSVSSDGASTEGASSRSCRFSRDASRDSARSPSFDRDSLDVPGDARAGSRRRNRSPHSLVASSSQRVTSLVLSNPVEGARRAMEHEAKPAYGRRIGDLEGLPGRSVLVALSDPAVAGATAKQFAAANIAPTLAFSSAQLLDRVKEDSYALVVVDASLAQQEANVTQQIAETADVPVILVGEIKGALDIPLLKSP